MKKEILSEIRKFSNNIQNNKSLKIKNEDSLIKKQVSSDISQKKSNLIYLQSLKNISRKIIDKTAETECIDSESAKLVIKKCHEALNNLFIASDQKSKEIDQKNYILIINNYIELINNIEPYTEINSKILNEENNNNCKIDINNDIKYYNLQKAYKKIKIYKENINKSQKKSVQLPKINGINNLMINFIYENDNISYIESILNYIYKDLSATEIPNKDGKLKIICNIKAPINKTAILYYKFMLKIKKFIKLNTKNKILSNNEQEFINILEKYLNKDSLKIAKIFNLPELEIYVTKIGSRSKKDYIPLIQNIKTNDPTKMLINLIVKIEIARELAKKRRMTIYNEKGKVQDSLIMIDYFDEYSDKLFEFLTSHHNIYHIKNFITSNLLNLKKA